MKGLDNVCEKMVTEAKCPSSRQETGGAGLFEVRYTLFSLGLTRWCDVSSGVQAGVWGNTSQVMVWFLAGYV